jgi:hypothetical protein
LVEEQPSPAVPPPPQLFGPGLDVSSGDCSWFLQYGTKCLYFRDIRDIYYIFPHWWPSVGVITGILIFFFVQYIHWYCALTPLRREVVINLMFISERPADMVIFNTLPLQYLWEISIAWPVQSSFHNKGGSLISIYLALCLYLSSSMSLSIYLYASIYLSLCLYLAIYISMSLSIYLSISMSLSNYLFVFI